MIDKFVVPTAYRRAIRPELCDALERYFNERLVTGHFLRAVLENDWLGAIKRQNPISLAEHMWLADLLIECAPSVAWGSKEAVAAWLETPLTARDEADEVRRR